MYSHFILRTHIVRFRDEERCLWSSAEVGSSVQREQRWCQSCLWSPTITTGQLQQEQSLLFFLTKKFKKTYFVLLLVPSPQFIEVKLEKRRHKLTRRRCTSPLPVSLNDAISSASSLVNIKCVSVARWRAREAICSLTLTHVSAWLDKRIQTVSTGTHFRRVMALK